jgi:hypothetical protein
MSPEKLSRRRERSALGKKTMMENGICLCKQFVAAE